MLHKFITVARAEIEVIQFQRCYTSKLQGLFKGKLTVYNIEISRDKTPFNQTSQVLDDNINLRYVH